MTPISRTLNVMACVKLDQEDRPMESKKKTTVPNYSNLDFPSCKDLVIKDRLTQLNQLKHDYTALIQLALSRLVLFSERKHLL